MPRGKPKNAKWVQEVRKNAGLKQTEFAQKIGVHSMTVSRWERGTIAMRPDQVIKIEETFKVKFEDFSKVPNPMISPAMFRALIESGKKPTFESIQRLHAMQQAAGFSFDEETCRLILEEDEELVAAENSTSIQMLLAIESAVGYRLSNRLRSHLLSKIESNY